LNHQLVALNQVLIAVHGLHKPQSLKESIIRYLPLIE
jgi:hypothetical protein